MIDFGQGEFSLPGTIKNISIVVRQRSSLNMPLCVILA